MAAAARRARVLLPLLLATVTVIAATALVHGEAAARNVSRHHWEDWRFFRHNRTQVHSVADCFTQASVWPGLYRPLSTNCYYLAGRVLWRNDIEAYHAVNAALYVVNAVLLFAIAARLLPWPLALVAAALWASRVANRQLLLYTSEFQGLLAAFLSLAALLLALPARVEPAPPAPVAARPWWRRRETAALLAFAAALLSKESAVVLPAIVFAAGWLYTGRLQRRDAAWGAVAAAWALLFVMVLRGISGYAPTGYSYDVSGGMAARLAAYALMFSNAAVLPVDDWAVPTRIPALAASAAVAVPFAAALALLVGAVAAARRLPAWPAGAALRPLLLGFCWFLAGSAPYVVFEDRLFLRYAYFGGAGLALMLAAVPQAAAEWWRVRRAAAAPAASAPTPEPGPP